MTRPWEGVPTIINQSIGEASYHLDALLLPLGALLRGVQDAKRNVG